MYKDYNEPNELDVFLLIVKNVESTKNTYVMSGVKQIIKKQI